MNKSVLLILLIAVPLLLFSFANFGFAQSGTQVGGTINVDTTWTQANSPYNLTSPLIVSYGTPLTVQPGVTVNLNGYNLQVNGILCARGSNGSSIVFDSSGTGNVALTASSTSWNEQTGKGCIIENADFNNASIFISDTAPKLDNNIINVGTNSEDGAINLESGTAVISDNIIYGDIQCMDGASPTISDNFIQGEIYGQGFDISAPVIINNTIEGGANQVLENAGIFADGTNYYIANNTIFNCGNAIVIAAGTQVITENLIINNTDAITISGPSSVSTTIIHNTICNNTNGLSSYEFAGSATIAYNNIVNNTQYSFGGNLTYNWWGTTNQTAIAQMLPNGTAINPILTSPDTQAPAIPNITTAPSPSPTPTPTPSTSPTQSQTSTTDSSTNPTSTPTGQPTASPYQPATAIPEVSTIVALTLLTVSLAIAVVITMKKRNTSKS